MLKYFFVNIIYGGLHMNKKFMKGFMISSKICQTYEEISVISLTDKEDSDEYFEIIDKLKLLIIEEDKTYSLLNLEDIKQYLLKVFKEEIPDEELYNLNEYIKQLTNVLVDELYDIAKDKIETLDEKQISTVVRHEILHEYLKHERRLLSKLAKDMDSEVDFDDLDDLSIQELKRTL